jgi:hypothetical protein
MTDLHPVLARLGGRRGLVDGAVPPLVFVGVHAATGLTPAAEAALGWAVVLSGLTGLGIVVVRSLRGEPLGGGLRGLVGLAVAAAFAAWTGQARDFFLPGIYVDAAWALLLLGSVALQQPLVGHAYGALFRQGRDWRRSSRLRRVLAAATVGWAAVYTARAAAQAVLYRADEPELLALVKLLLGWPVTVAAVALTLAAVRWARPALPSVPA